MSHVNVIWYGTERFSFSCAAMLNEALDQHRCKHHFSGQMPSSGQGAVIVFHGGNQRDIAGTLNYWAGSMPWSILISIGDESCEFPYHHLDRAPNRRLWVQTPSIKRFEFFDRTFIEGYPADCPRMLRELGDVPRDLDFFFAGQITHQRRQECATALRQMLVNGDRGQALFTESFGAGIPYKEYCQFLKRSKVVPCPAGPATPDTFRFAEALEAGCVPVLDTHSSDGTLGYWDLVLGTDHPFYLVPNWSTFPSVLGEILSDYERHRRACAHWWLRHKLNFRSWLQRDILSLGGEIS